MIFNYYSKDNTPRGHCKSCNSEASELSLTPTSVDVPKVWIMGQIMSVALETIEEADESEDSLETPSSPIVPARLTEMTTFPYLVDFCKQSGSATLAHLLEMMHQEELENEPAAHATRENDSLRDEELYVEIPNHQPISSMGWGKPF